MNTAEVKEAIGKLGTMVQATTAGPDGQGPSGALDILRGAVDALARECEMRRAARATAAEEMAALVVSLRDYLETADTGVSEAAEAKAAALASEVETLKAALEEAESRAKQAERQGQEGAQALAQLRTLEEHLQKRGETINEARRRILRLQEKLEALVAESAADKEKLKEQEATLVRRNAALKAAEDRFSDLRRRMDAAGGSAAPGMQAQVKVLENQVEEAQKAAAALEERHGKLQQELNQRVAAEAAARQRIEEMKHQVDDAEHERGEMAKRMGRLEDELRKASDARDEASAQAKKAAEALQRAEAAAEAAKKDLAAARGQNGALAAEKAALEARVAELAPKAAELEKERAAAAEKLAALGREKDEALASAEASGRRAGELEKALSEIEARVAAEQGEAGSAREEAARLSSEIGALQQRAETAEKEAAAACGTLEAAQTEAEAARARADAAHERVAALEAELSERDGALEAAEKRADEASERAVAAEGAVSDAQGRLGALEAVAETLRADIAAFQEKAAEADQFRAEADAARERAMSLQEQLDKEQAKGLKSALALQLAEAIRESEAAQEELSSLRREVERLRKSEAAPVPAAPAAHAAPAEEADEETALRKAYEAMPADKRNNLGELLVAARVITKKQLADVNSAVKKSPDLGMVAVICEKGLTDEDTVVRALSLQSGAPVAEVGEDGLDAEAATLISDKIARKHRVIPLREEEGALILAMSNPMDLLALEDVGRAAGKPVKPMVARHSAVMNAINRYYWEPE